MSARLVTARSRFGACSRAVTATCRFTHSTRSKGSRSRANASSQTPPLREGLLNHSDDLELRAGMLSVPSLSQRPDFAYLLPQPPARGDRLGGVEAALVVPVA